MPDDIANSSTSLKDILEKDIFTLIGGQNLPDEKKDELMQKMIASIQNRVIARIDDLLNESERDELKDLIDKDHMVGFDRLLKRKGINLQELMEDEALNYKTQVVSLVDYTKQSTQIAIDADKQTKAV